jgi:ribosomal protein S18 acetylase RimI-like enzyme
MMPYFKKYQGVQWLVLCMLIYRNENAGISILEYLRFGFKVGRIVDSYLADDRETIFNRL